MNFKKSVITFIIVIIFACFAATVLFTLPALSTIFNLTTKANIGSAIGGITAPIIGIFSSVLLYLALTAQTASNINQSLKNESDILFLLIDQLSKEVNNFYATSKKDKRDGSEAIKVTVTGIEGLNDFTREYRYESYVDDLKGSVTFKMMYEAKQISLFVDSFNLTKKRISITNLSPELKELFQHKLNSYFYSILRTPLKSLSEAFDMYPHQKDFVTEKIQKLYLEQEVHYHAL